MYSLSYFSTYKYVCGMLQRSATIKSPAPQDDAGAPSRLAARSPMDRGREQKRNRGEAKALPRRSRVEAEGKLTGRARLLEINIHTSFN